MNEFSHTWIDLLKDLLSNGEMVSPRAYPTIELQHRTIQINMEKPVLRIPTRKLNYRFMAAEAHWILTGDDRVSTIVPYNGNLLQFSDDGERFFGAYGPKILGQLDYVIEKLILDGSSRQAGLTIWRENPPRTKDVPCTVAIFFSLRNGKIDTHVFMRSSDAWLGVPYDVFNFSTVTYLVCALLNERKMDGGYVTPGDLYLTAASSHLYLSDKEKALVCIRDDPLHQASVPPVMYMNSVYLLETLKSLRDSRPGDAVRWWEQV